MTKVNEVAALYKQLKSEWSSSHRNLTKCEKLLSDLKVFCSYLNISSILLIYILFIARINKSNFSTNIKYHCIQTRTFTSKRCFGDWCAMGHRGK